MRITCIILWLLVPAPLVLSVIASPASDAAGIVDLASKKDVVWLSLATAICAMGFSAWREVKREKHSDLATCALIDAAKEMKGLTISINDLRVEIRDRMRD